MDREMHIDWQGNPALQDAFAGSAIGQTAKSEVTYTFTDITNDGAVVRILSVSPPVKADPVEASLPDKTGDMPMPITDHSDGMPMNEDPAVLIVLKRREQEKE